VLSFLIVRSSWWHKISSSFRDIGFQAVKALSFSAEDILNRLLNVGKKLSLKN
jgi:hypothetical protein